MDETSIEPPAPTPAPTVLSPLPEVGDVLWERFPILEALGRGGMGVVYRCRDTRHRGQEVAVKVLHPELMSSPDLRGRVRDEATLARSLDHPNVSRVFDYHEDEALVGVSMALLEGDTLEDHFSGRAGSSIFQGTITPNRLRMANHVADQLEAGLRYIHSRQCVHCDVKPSNIWISNPDSSGQVGVKLIDFGLMDVMGESHEDLRRRQGTWEYMSPARRSAEQRSSEASDRYALGVVEYRLFSGVMPVFRSHLDQVPLPPSTIIDAIDEEQDERVLSLFLQDQWPLAVEERAESTVQPPLPSPEEQDPPPDESRLESKLDHRADTVRNSGVPGALWWLTGSALLFVGNILLFVCAGWIAIPVLVSLVDGFDYEPYVYIMALPLLVTPPVGIGMALAALGALLRRRQRALPWARFVAAFWFATIASYLVYSVVDGLAVVFWSGLSFMSPNTTGMWIYLIPATFFSSVVLTILETLTMQRLVRAARSVNRENRTA